MENCFASTWQRQTTNPSAATTRCRLHKGDKANKTSNYLPRLPTVGSGGRSSTLIDACGSALRRRTTVLAFAAAFNFSHASRATGIASANTGWITRSVLDGAAVAAAAEDAPNATWSKFGRKSTSSLSSTSSRCCRLRAVDCDGNNKQNSTKKSLSIMVEEASQPTTTPSCTERRNRGGSTQPAPQRKQHVCLL